MPSIEEMVGRLQEAFSPEDRATLIAALLAAQPSKAAPAPVVSVPEPEQTVSNAGLSPGPQLTPETPTEKGDTPEDRARLLHILMENPSGVSGYVLLDAYRIPPATIEFAIRDGQATPRAERGVGLTRTYGGPW